MIRIRFVHLDAALLLMVSLPFIGCHDGNAPPPTVGGGDTSPPAMTGTTTGTTASITPGNSATPTDGRETVVHVEDDGKSFDLPKGAPLTVSLASHAGTGYVWTPTNVDTNVLAQQGQRTVEATSSVPGGPTSDVYRFTAVNAGTTALEMSLKRPFGSGDPVRAIHVTIHVH